MSGTRTQYSKDNENEFHGAWRSGPLFNRDHGAALIDVFSPIDMVPAEERIAYLVGKSYPILSRSPYIVEML